MENSAVKPVVNVFKIDFLKKDSYDFFKNTRFGMWEVSSKTPHTQLLCRVQFYKLPLKLNRAPLGTLKSIWNTMFLILVFPIIMIGGRFTYRHLCFTSIYLEPSRLLQYFWNYFFMIVKIHLIVSKIYCILFKNLQFGAGRTTIKNVILFYFIFNIIHNKNGFMCRIQIKEGILINKFNFY